MKSKVRTAAVAAGLALLFLCLFAADTVVVKIQTTALRKEPRFTAPVAATLTAGTSLEKLAASGGWVQVKTAAGAVGWIHSSAVETKKFTLASLDKNAKTQASAGEVALAAKGFNKQVEDAYRTKNAQANFAAVESMLKVEATAAEIEAFLKRGRLGTLGGAK